MRGGNVLVWPGTDFPEVLCCNGHSVVSVLAPPPGSAGGQESPCGGELAMVS